MMMSTPLFLAALVVGSTSALPSNSLEGINTPNSKPDVAADPSTSSIPIHFAKLPSNFTMLPHTAFSGNGESVNEPMSGKGGMEGRLFDEWSANFTSSKAVGTYNCRAFNDNFRHYRQANSFIDSDHHHNKSFHDQRPHHEHFHHANLTHDEMPFELYSHKQVKNAFMAATYLVSMHRYVASTAERHMVYEPRLLQDQDSSISNLRKAFSPDVDGACRSASNQLYSFPITHAHGFYNGKWAGRARVIVTTTQGAGNNNHLCAVVDLHDKKDQSSVKMCKLATTSEPKMPHPVNLTPVNKGM